MEITTNEILDLYDILKRIDSLNNRNMNKQRIFIGNPDATIHIDIVCFDKCWEVYLNDESVFRSLYNEDRITEAIDLIRREAKMNKIFYQYSAD
jgi:hypothetical protein